MIIVDFMIETSTPNQHYFVPIFFLGLSGSKEDVRGNFYLILFTDSLEKIILRFPLSIVKVRYLRPPSQTDFDEHLAELPRSETLTICEK